MRLVLPPAGRLVLLAMLILMAAMFPLRAPIGQQPAPPTSVSDLQALAASIEDEAKRKDLLATIRALITAKESGGAATTPAPLSERIVVFRRSSSRGGGGGRRHLELLR